MLLLQKAKFHRFECEEIRCTFCTEIYTSYFMGSGMDFDDGLDKCRW